MDVGVGEMRAPGGTVAGHEEPGCYSWGSCVLGWVWRVDFALVSEIGEYIQGSRCVVESCVKGYDDVGE